MKLILSATVFLLPALGLLTGCGRDGDKATADAQQVADAKRRNAELKQLTQLQEQPSPVLESSDLEESRQARIQNKHASRRFNGKWVVTALTLDGVEVSADNLKEVPWYWVVNDGTILSKRPGSSGRPIHEEEILFSIDPSKSPKTIELDHKEKKEFNKGIFDFDGDGLKICYAMNPNGQRPADFTAGKNSKQVLMILNPVKE